MKRYIKLYWNSEQSDEPLPRILMLDKNIENDAELKQIIQARGQCELKSIKEYMPKNQWLVLYIDISHGQDSPMLKLTLTDTYSEKAADNWAVLKSFGFREESQLIFDSVRCAGYYSIVDENSNNLYFREHVINCHGQMNSVLQLIACIVKTTNYYTSEDLLKSEISKN